MTALYKFILFDSSQTQSDILQDLSASVLTPDWLNWFNGIAF